MKNPAIADYLKLYEKLRGGTSASYARYLAQSNVDPEGAYAKAVTAAKNTYARALSEYGTTAEKLARKGLGDSGYSALLAEGVRDRYQSALEQAERQRTQNVQQNISGYADYLLKEGKAAKSMVGELQNKGVSDFDTAYAYALTSGLDKDTATLTATLVGQMANKAAGTTAVKQRVTILRRLVELNLPRDSAYAYALACGVGDEVAGELADAATRAVQERNQNHHIAY